MAHFHACSPENREAIIDALDGSRSQFKAALNDVDWAVQTALFQDSATNRVQIYSCQDEYSDVRKCTLKNLNCSLLQLCEIYNRTCRNFNSRFNYQGRRLEGGRVGGFEGVRTHPLIGTKGRSALTMPFFSSSVFDPSAAVQAMRLIAYVRVPSPV